MSTLERLAKRPVSEQPRKDNLPNPNSEMGLASTTGLMLD
jgi:hypothetical protein